MELYCIETELEPIASFDPAIVDDDRILGNLILTEERYLITGSYFKCLQTDLKISMRDVVANWMLEVCEEERCQSEVFPLAMNMLDRFLAVVKIRKTQLQLLGSVCLFLASKLRQSRPISPQILVQYTDWSITLEELTGWELLVLSRLKWDVAAVTPNDFIAPLLRRLSKKFPLIDEHQGRIMKHSFNMIDLCSADFNFSMLPSSMIATASIVTAVDGLLTLTQNEYLCKSISSQILYQLHKITSIEKDLLRNCQLQIEQRILQHLSGIKTPNGSRKGDKGDDDNDSPIDCPKENFNSSMINSSDNYYIQNVFKHAACVSSDASIGVEY